MSTSIVLLDQNFNANDVDIMVFKPCVLFPPCGRLGGGIEHMVRRNKKERVATLGTNTSYDRLELGCHTTSFQSVFDLEIISIEGL